MSRKRCWQTRTHTHTYTHTHARAHTGDFDQSFFPPVLQHQDVSLHSFTKQFCDIKTFHCAVSLNIYCKWNICLSYEKRFLLLLLASRNSCFYTRRLNSTPSFSVQDLTLKGIPRWRPFCLRSRPSHKRCEAKSFFFPFSFFKAQWNWLTTCGGQCVSARSTWHHRIHPYGSDTQVPAGWGC